MAIILDGKATAQAIKKDILQKVQTIKGKGAKVPHLAAILIGNDPASHTYVKNKVDACKQVGFQSTLIKYEDIDEGALLQNIDEVNENETIDGLLVQLPLPPSIDVQKVINRINPEKDVDGFHPFNYGRMACQLPAHIPATPLGIIELLKHYNIETVGQHCVIAGKSRIVGAPLSILMSREGYPGDATVTLCHKLTKDVAAFTREADILIVAVGKPGLITASMVKEGAVVIDVGTTRVPDATQQKGFTLKGDVDFANVAPLCSYITPVPGGVGPMTIASLLLNTLKAAQKQVYVE